MSTKLTITIDETLSDWLRQFAYDRGQSMGEVVRIELEALYQNYMAAEAARALIDADEVGSVG